MATLTPAEAARLIRELDLQDHTLSFVGPSGAIGLSDQEIADALAADGVALARRTVAKYRDELQILPARLRHR